MKLKFKLIALFSIILLCSVSLFASAQVYVRIELQPDTWHYYDSDYDEVQVYDMYVRAYSNSACTIPVTLSSDISVGLQCYHTYQTSYYSSSSTSNVYLPINTGESEYYYDDRPLSLLTYTPYAHDSFSYSIIPGSGYTVVSGYTFL